jgi:hypothetical protein
MLSLLPPTRRFYRLVIAEEVKNRMMPGESSEVEKALAKAEAAIQQQIEEVGLRLVAFEAFRQLVNSGNALLFIDKKCRMFPLHQYVVRRDGEGELLEIVVKECVDVETLPDSVKGFTKARIASESSTHAQPQNEVDLYTHVYKQGNTWHTYQEVKGNTVPESAGHYGADRSPWIPLRWTRIDGEDYGRSHSDDYYGDLSTAEVLSRSIVRASAIAAKVVFLVKPNSMTKASDLASAEEGDFVDGDKQDVEALGLDKLQDFQIAKTVLDEVTARIYFAYLVNAAARRDGERVTAEEIRYIAQEIEDGLGGAYSVLSHEFQLPVVNAVIAMMRQKGTIPKVIDGKKIKPTIITGIDALGRSHEIARLESFAQGAIQLFGPEVAQYINVPEYLKRRATGLDIDTEGLLKTQEEISSEQQQAQMAEAGVKAAPNIVKGISDQMLAQQQAPTQ